MAVLFLASVQFLATAFTVLTYKWNRSIWTAEIDKIVVKNVYFLHWFVKTWWWFISASFLISYQHFFAFVWATGFPNFIPRRYQFDSKMTSLPLFNALGYILWSFFSSLFWPCSELGTKMLELPYLKWASFKNGLVSKKYSKGQDYLGTFTVHRIIHFGLCETFFSTFHS